jgi:hypothetical protein
MPIDYSKWDHIEDESSDEDVQDNDVRSDMAVMPRVTRLNAPSKVTFGGNQNNNNNNNNNDRIVNVEESSTQAMPTTTASSLSSSTTKTLTQSRSTTQVENWTQKGGVVVVTTTNHDTTNRQLYWCQDRYSVTLRLTLKEDEKVESVKIDGILSYADRHSATGTTTKPHLTCRRVKQQSKDTEDTNNVIILEGDLPHPVHYAEDDDEDIDWCIVRDDDGSNNHQNNSTRYLQITLYKAVPMVGMFVWWRRPLMQYSEIESWMGDHNNYEEFRHAWEEAHKIFQQNRQQSNRKNEETSTQK